MSNTPRRLLPDRLLGCLLGGAIGDALGAPVEGLSLDDIRRRYGPEGLTGHGTPSWSRHTRYRA